MIKKNLLHQMVFLVGFLFLSISAFAGGTVWLKPNGNGVWDLDAEGFDTVSGLDVTVTFDTAFLSSPNVAFIQNGMNVANPNAGPGKLRIAALSTQGFTNGPIAKITFTVKSGVTGKMKAPGLVVTGIDLKGANQNLTPMVSETNTTGGGDGSSSTQSGPTGQGSSVTTVGSSAGTAGLATVVGGTLTMPSDDSGSKDRKEQYIQPEPAPSTRTAIAKETVPAATESRDQVASQKAPEPAPPAPPVPSVLERFRVFTGERTVDNLTALFDRGDVSNFAQDPAIFIADGKKTVKANISKVGGDKAPNFAFNSARYVSLAKGAEGEWVIEVKPEKSAFDASINMLVNGATQEFPLVVAPKARVDLIKKGQVTQADFEKFLKERGTDAAPKHDLNGDGKRDYIDDYIFTANYLVEREKQAAKEKSQHKAKTAKE